MNQQITTKNNDQNNSGDIRVDARVEPVEITLSARTVARIVLLVLLILFVVSVAQTLFYELGFLLLLIVLAIFFAYLIAPLVELIQKPFAARNQSRWMPRPLAIGLIYVLLFVGLYTAITYVAPLVSDQVSQLAGQLPTYSGRLRSRFDEVNRRYERTPIPPALRESIETSLTRLGENIGETTTSTLGAVALSLFTLLPALVLIPVLGFFFLKDAKLFQLAAVRAFPRGQLRGRAELFLQDLNRTLRAYVRAQIISCALIGVICTIGFYVIGVPYALLLGIAAAVFEFIPLVGPLIIAVSAVTIASFYSGYQALYVLIFLLVLRMLQDYVFYPRIIREGIHLHPLAIILAVLAGGEISGVTGIFLSIPVVAVSTVAYRHLMEHSGSTGIVANLLDEGKTDQAIDVAEKRLDQIHQQAEQQLRPEGGNPK